jgi:type III restriction enzyme
MTAPNFLIVNPPFELPRWRRERQGSLEWADDRRLAGYEIFDTRNNTRRIEPLGLAERIRGRVNEWRSAGYPGVTTVTCGLLEVSHNRRQCQNPPLALP